MTEIIPSVFDVPKETKLTIEELAEALYEGTPHLEFLMHKMARQYTDPGTVLPPWCAQNDNCKDFWRLIAVNIQEYAIKGGYRKYKEESLEEPHTQIIR